MPVADILEMVALGAYGIDRCFFMFKAVHSAEELLSCYVNSLKSDEKSFEVR